jgi:hypothetical protein
MAAGAERSNSARADRHGRDPLGGGPRAGRGRPDQAFPAANQPAACVTVNRRQPAGDPGSIHLIGQPGARGWPAQDRTGKCQLSTRRAPRRCRGRHRATSISRSAGQPHLPEFHATEPPCGVQRAGTEPGDPAALGGSHAAATPGALHRAVAEPGSRVRAPVFRNCADDRIRAELTFARIVTRLHPVIRPRCTHGSSSR